jgi:hypothetical protein
MKNSKEYVKKITNLYHSLKHKNIKIEQPVYKQISESLIYGIISEKLCEKDSQNAIKRFSGYFVDYNDLRVSRIDEIAELLGSDTAINRQVALSLTTILQKIFNENHQINLESLHKLGKRQARQKLEKLFTSAAKIMTRATDSPGEMTGQEHHDSDMEPTMNRSDTGQEHPDDPLPVQDDLRRLAPALSEKADAGVAGGQFPIDYCMLTSLASHCIPLTEKMIEYLKSNDLVDDKADAQAIEGFLSKQISAKNGYDFYALLRHESETAFIASKLHTGKTAPAAVKKTAKKTVKTEKTPQPPRLSTRVEAAGKKKGKK